MAEFDDIDLDTINMDELDMDSISLDDIDLDTIDLDNLDAAAVQPEPRDPNTIGSAIGRGIGTQFAGVGGAAEAVGELVGSEDLTAWGKEYRDEARKDAAKYGQSSAPQLLDAETPEDYLGFAREVFGQAIPSVAVTAGGGVAGNTVAGPWGAVAGALLSSSVLGAGEVQNAIKEIDPEANNPLASLGTGLVIGALDATGFGIIFRPIIKRIGIDAAKAVALKELAKRGVASKTAEGLVKGALGEGLTEVAQEFAKETAVSGVTGEEKSYDQSIKDYVDAAAGGALAGGTFRGAAELRSAAFDTTLREGDIDLLKQEQDRQALETENLRKPGEVKVALQGIANKPTDRLEYLTAISPTFGRIMDQFRNRKDSTLTSNTMFANQEALTGQYNEAFTQVTRGISKRKANKILREYSEGDRSTPRHRAAAKMFDSIQELAHAKLNTGKLRNYLPSHLDASKIKKDPEAFIAAIAPYVPEARTKVETLLKQMENEFSETGALLGTAERIFDKQGTLSDAANDKGSSTLIRNSINKVGQRKPSKFGQLEAHRLLSQVPQKILNDFSKGDIVESVEGYIRKSAQRIVAADTWGVNFEKLNAGVAQLVLDASLYQGKQDPVTGAFEFPDGVVLTESDMKHIYDIVDASNHQYQSIETNIGRQSAAVVNTISTGMTLPLSTFSSFVEIFNIASKGDVSLMFRSLMPAIRNGSRNMVTKAFSSVEETDQAKDMHAANITFSSSQSVQAQRMTDVATTRWSAKANKLFFTANGLSAWTHMVRVWSATAADMQIKEDLDTIKSFNVNTRRGALAQGRLNELGVDAQLYFQSSSEVKRVIRAEGIRRFVHETVLEPNYADKPLWLSSGKLSIIAKLKGYPTVWTNTILPQIAGKMDVNKLGGYNAAAGFLDASFIIGGMLLVGAVQDAMKQTIKATSTDWQDDRDEVEYAMDILGKTIMPIQLSYLTSGYNATKYGSSPVDSALGPTIGLINDTTRTMIQLGKDGDPEDLEKYLLKITPLRPWASAILD